MTGGSTDAKMRNTLRSFEDAYPREFFRHLVADFSIPKERVRELNVWLRRAYDIYASQQWLSNSRSKTVADKQSAKRLKNALHDALIEISQPGMWPRLNKADKIAFPDAIDGEVGTTPRWCPDMWTTLIQLHEIAKAAYELDGKILKGERQTREDVRGFAVALWWFWTQVLGRKAVLHERWPEPAGFVQFVLNCIHQIDEAATDSPFRYLTDAAS